MQIALLKYEVIVLKNAQKQLLALSHEEQLKILKKLELLTINQVSLDIKKLKGYKTLYRIRSGDYRIVYKNDQKGKIFLVTLICHRRDVYKHKIHEV